MRPDRSTLPVHLLALVAALLAAGLVALLPLAPAVATPAGGADGLLCRDGIARAERAEGLPEGLLQAIGLAEAGLYDPARRTTLPWPWTVNAGGEAARLASKEEAIRHVERLRAQGRDNIDVGCMQINLGWHPAAFADLAEAFDPELNAAYGAAYLVALREEAGSWEGAVERYHSRDPDRGQSYRERVWRHWATGPGVSGPVATGQPATGPAAGRASGAHPAAPAAADQPLLLATSAGRAAERGGRPPAARDRPLPLATVPVRKAAIERAALQSVNRVAARQTWRWLQVQAPMPAELPAGPPPAVVAALDPTAALPAAGALVPAAALARPLVFAGPGRPRAVAAVPGRIPGLAAARPARPPAPAPGPPRRLAAAS